MKAWRNITLAALIGLAIWQTVVWLTGLPHFILPSPLRVATAMWNSRVIIAEHSLVTLTEVLIGIAIGSALGMATAIQLAISTRARDIMRPLLVFSQAVPVFALAPILTLWLGYGLWSKVAMAVLIIYFPVTSAFLDGLMRTPQGFLDQARVMGATPLTTMLRIRIPAALPSLGSGLRLAAVYAPIGAIIGELPSGIGDGLGRAILDFSSDYSLISTPKLWASIIMAASVGVFFFVAVSIVERLVLGRYIKNI